MMQAKTHDTALTQLSFTEAGPTRDTSLSQWFTPAHIADHMVALANVHLRGRSDLRILEPSSGRGNLIRAIKARAVMGCHIDAVELDERYREELEALDVNVHIGCYLEPPAPPKPYHIVFTNPPFDPGIECAHIEKMLGEALRIIALLPARSLHGAERFRRIWSRVGKGKPGEGWWMREAIHFVTRPKFADAGGTDEIVIVDLQRVPGDCKVRWL